MKLQNMQLSRREFVKLGAATGAAAAFIAPLALPLNRVALAEGQGNSAPVASTAKGVLIDTTKCIGCRTCEAACKKVNGLPASAPADKETLTATTYTVIQTKPIPTKEDPKAVQPVKVGCMHCINPACASVCPVEAFHKTPEGPVVYRADRCIGCRYCMMACPFGVPRYEWQSTTPYVRKCQMCDERQAKGLQPACTEACPTGALKFGVRADLITEAENRIKATPDKYVNYIYGKEEVGGTSVLYMAKVPFDKLGFRTDLPTQAPPEATAEVMTKIPGIVVGAAAILGGIAYFRKPPAAAGARRAEEEPAEEEKLRKAA
jgi:formate dehydrogenase iron-sulfur subunit